MKKCRRIRKLWNLRDIHGYPGHPIDAATGKRFHIYYRIDQMSSFNSVKVPFPHSSFYPTWTPGHASAVQAVFPIATHSIIVTITVWNRRKFVGYLNESTLLFTSNCFLWASMALSDAFCCFPDPLLYFRINFCMYNRIQAAVIRGQNTCTENSSCHESKIYFAKLVCEVLSLKLV